MTIRVPAMSSILFYLIARKIIGTLHLCSVVTFPHYAKIVKTDRCHVLQSPSLNWREVVKELDYPGFLITNKHGLRLVTMAIRKALHGAFPVEELLLPWGNTEGQVGVPLPLASFMYTNVLPIVDLVCYLRIPF